MYLDYMKGTSLSPPRSLFSFVLQRAVTHNLEEWNSIKISSNFWSLFSFIPTDDFKSRNPKDKTIVVYF